jgi:site-specific DNA-methyltransferase (adenine-specific)
MTAMALAKQLLSSNDQTWATPRGFFERLDAIFHFRLDPCAAHETAKCSAYFTKDDDGLRQEWAAIGNAFVNPPYGRELPRWMRKSSEEAANGITVVMLIPARVDTSYWHDIAFQHARCVCFLRGRLTFELHGVDAPARSEMPAPFPSAIVVFGPCSVEQMRQLEQFGRVFAVSRSDN